MIKIVLLNHIVLQQKNNKVFNMKLSKFKKIFLIGFLIITIMLIPIAIKHKDLLRDLLTIRISNTIENTNTEPVLAVFSFDAPQDSKLIKPSYHLRLKLSRSTGLSFDEEILNKFTADNIPLIITIETWGTNAINSYRKNPMNDLIDGKFDNAIKELCIDLIKKRPNVYIRFNPEIEVPYKRYPWQGYVQEYIDAFGYLAKLCKKYTPQIQMVWGASGYPGALEYYPGDHVVDVASVIMKSDSEMKLEVYPKDYPLKYDLIRRLHRMRFLDKPIFVFGSKNIAKDALDKGMVSEVVKYIQEEKNIVYSKENYIRPNPIDKDTIRGNIKIGLYDPNDFLNNEPSISMEHLFADFENINNGTFEGRFKRVIERNHDVIVTFEPFRHHQKEYDAEVLKHVLHGNYDEEIKAFYKIILSTNHTVYLRYAHEMEIPITRYPWQSQDPVTYIKSYRYFMTFIDSIPENVKRVWGPAGDRGSIEWYPGNDVVDVMSIAIYGLPDKNITDPNMQESFSTIFKRKTWRLRFIDKPLFITEFGVKGPEEYQTKWLEDAALVLRENPQIIGVNYFNMSDTPKAWGEIKPPDWSITKETLLHFVATLNK